MWHKPLDSNGIDTLRNQIIDGYEALSRDDLRAFKTRGRLPVSVRQALLTEQRLGNLDSFAEPPGTDGAPFRFVDLFAGIGGIRIPFQELGGECDMTSEWDKFAQVTYERNFGEVPKGRYYEDQCQIGARSRSTACRLSVQAFSLAGLKQGFSDTRDNIVRNLAGFDRQVAKSNFA